MPYHWFQPRPPKRPVLAAVFIFGGVGVCLAIIFVAWALLSSALPPATLLHVGVACLIIALAQAVIGGVFVSQWKPNPERTVRFFLTGAVGLLFILWVGLGLALLTFNPLAPPDVILDMQEIGFGLGAVFSLPYVIVRFRQRQRDRQRARQEGSADNY